MADLKEDFASLKVDIPEMMASLYEHLADEVLNLVEHYSSAIGELRGRCENLRLALINFEEVKQLEKQRLI